MQSGNLDRGRGKLCLAADTLIQGNGRELKWYRYLLVFSRCILSYTSPGLVPANVYRNESKVLFIYFIFISQISDN